MQSDTIHTAIVEDDPEIRQLLQMIVDASPGFSCKYAYPDAEKAVADLPGKAVHIVLMDIELPGISGIECVRILREKGQDMDFLMLSVLEDDEAIFNSLCAGASGYLVKETPPVQLLEAIRDCYAGGSPMSAGIARKVIKSFHRQPAPDLLSERETEVLRMLCDGANYKSIAEKLCVSSNTIKAHIKHIYTKLQVHTRAEAVTRALKDNLI